MPRLDLDAIPAINHSRYPEPFAADVAGRWHKSLADAGGVTDFGICHVRLEPGAWSAQRHWHEGEDEFVVMLSGETLLIEDERRTPMRAGDCAVFPKAIANGHHLVNESDAPCVFIAFGRAISKDCHYPDIDLRVDGASGGFFHKDGRSY